MIMRYYRKRYREQHREQHIVSIPENMLDHEPNHEEVIELIDIAVVRGLGGRPKGATNTKRKIGEVDVIAAVN